MRHGNCKMNREALATEVAVAASARLDQVRDGRMNTGGRLRTRQLLCLAVASVLGPALVSQRAFGGDLDIESNTNLNTALTVSGIFSVSNSNSPADLHDATYELDTGAALIANGNEVLGNSFTYSTYDFLQGYTYIDDGGLGKIVQTAGSNQVGQTLIVGGGLLSNFTTGEYDLTGSAGQASLSANAVLLGTNSRGIFNQNGTTSFVVTTDFTFNDHSVYTQYNGSLQIGGNLSLGQNGTFMKSYGSMNVSGSETVNAYGSYGFYQSGGTHTVGSSSVPSSLVIGDTATDIGYFSLDNSSGLGSSLTVYGDEYIGKSATGGGPVSGGTFQQSGGAHSVIGNLHLGALTSSASGIYFLKGGSLQTTAGSEFIGESGAGTFIQTGGSNTIGTNSSPATLYLGENSNSTGYYALDNTNGAASLTVYGNEQMGYAGVGSLTQSQGTHTVNGSLYLGNIFGATGLYYLRAGILKAGITPGEEFIGDLGTGQFTQTGGDHFVGSPTQNSNLYLGWGNQSTGQYTMDSSNGPSTLTVYGNEYVAYGAQGGNTNASATFFTQNAGVHTVHGNLSVADQNGSNGTFSLEGGSLSAVNLYVGKNGTGTFFEDHAGTISTLSGTLYVGNTANSNASGTYLFSGGSLTASNIVVAANSTFNEFGGTIKAVNFNTSGTTTVSNYTLGSAATSNGAAVSLQGGTFTAATVNVNTGGSFNQTGGSYHINTFNLSGGTLSLNSQLIIDPATSQNFNFFSGNLFVSGMVVGQNGLASFTQGSGSNLTIGTPTSPANLEIAQHAYSTGTYTLTGTAQLTVNGDEYVAENDAFFFPTISTGTFNQSGGTHTVSGSLSVSTHVGSIGVYRLGGSGQLSANAELIGGAPAPLLGTAPVAGGTAVFTQSAGTNTITGSAANSFYIFGNQSFYALSGGTLNLPTAAGAAVNGGGLFTLSGTGTVKGYLLNQSNINYDGAGNVDAGFIMSGGTYDAAGTLENDGGMALKGGTFAGTLLNTGMVTQTGGSVTGAVSNNNQYILSGGTFSATGANGGPQNTVSGIFSLQTGGTVSSTSFINQGSFFYTGGTFTGSLLNQGTANILTTNGSFSNAVENDSTMYIGLIGGFTSVAFNGAGLDNKGFLNMGNASISGTILNDYGGTLSYFSNATSATINGSLTNFGYFTPGTWTVTGSVNNAGRIFIQNLLNATGGVTNNGQIELGSGRLTGGAIVNEPGGVIQFDISGGVPYGFSQSFNNAGGVVIAQPGTLVTFSNFSSGNTAGGDIQIQNSATLTSNTPFPNSGTIELQASSALNGGAITNTGSITGLGRISNTVLNTGILESSGGKLTLSGAGSTNPAGGQIIVDATSTVQYTQGLSSSAGTITNNGGTFDNNNLPLTNSGIINGNGSFRTGGAGLTNTTLGIIDVTAGTSFFGPVTNNGSMDVYGSTTTFFGNVTVGTSAKVKITAGTVYFLGNAGASVSGLYSSDPSSNYFNGLTITSTGTVTGGSGDQFFMESGTVFSNAGSFNDGGTLSAGVVNSSGTFIQSGTLIETGNFTNSGTATIGGTQNWSHGTVFTNAAGTALFQTDAGANGSNLAIVVSAGTVNLASTQHLVALNISNGATATITGGGVGHRSMVYTPSLSVSGTLDLTGNDLDIQAGGPAALAMVSTKIASSYSNGTWTGTGITSSAAATDSTHLTAVGVKLIAAAGLLDGSAVAVNDVLAKDTYYGDANLDGKVDGSDYSRIDNGLLTNATGWYNGDFNYDGAVNGSDYTLIDNAYNSQGATLSANIAGPEAVATGQIAATTSVPEPAEFGLISLSALALLSRRIYKPPKWLARK